MTQNEAPTPATPAIATSASPNTCSVCPHPWADHDALGVRFCTATMGSANSRGCICRKSPV